MWESPRASLVTAQFRGPLPRGQLVQFNHCDGALLGCFSAYPGRNVVFRRTRARDNICRDQGRGPPLSGGLAWAAHPASSNIRAESSVYFALCQGVYWDPNVFTAFEFVSMDFTPRTPLRLSFCWSPPPP